MWMDEPTIELKERISRLSNEELLQMVEVEFDDYRKDALDFARAELMARGMEFEEPSSGQEIFSERAVPAEAPAASGVTCARCDSKTRPGVLLGEKEITIMFSDKDEQRFVEVYVCGKCGQVQLLVDLETDVAEDQGAALL